MDGTVTTRAQNLTLISEMLPVLLENCYPPPPPLFKQVKESMGRELPFSKSYP